LSDGGFFCLRIWRDDVFDAMRDLSHFNFYYIDFKVMMMLQPFNKKQLMICNRWWWHTRGKAYPPPDIKRSFTWFAPRATGRWRAFFYDKKYQINSLKIEMI